MTTDQLQFPLSQRGEFTSRVAAESVRRVAATLRADVLMLLEGSVDGLIGSEIVAAIGRDPWVVRPRLTELKIEGLVIKTKATRPGPNVRERVWMAATIARVGR